MQEDFLHYIWQYQQFSAIPLKTTDGSMLQITKVGIKNKKSGPDFFNAQLIINNQKWAGNVEIHVNSSDWYVHQHQNDNAYKTVILHVVWEDDVAIFDENNNALKTLVLKDKVAASLLKNYNKLQHTKNWIPCEKTIHTITNFTWVFWKEKLIINRLQRKTETLNNLLVKTNNNWEELLFLLLAKNFGIKINQQQFLQLAQYISFSVFKKENTNALALESILYGQANMLVKNIEDAYYQELQQEYKYQKKKHQLSGKLLQMEFFGLRPISFPTIRLSQLAMLYHKNTSLFSKIINIKTLEDAQNIFSVTASSYWDTHYTFGKKSSKRKKKLSNTFIELLLINTIIPLQYQYAKNLGKDNLEDLLALYKTIQPEKNGITKAFKNLKIPIKTALDSQSLIELKNEYCAQQKCLKCQIGNQLLHQKQK